MRPEDQVPPSLQVEPMARDRQQPAGDSLAPMITPYGELLAVFLEVDQPMDMADEKFFSSPFEIDHQHLAAMDDTTVEGARGRVHAELQYALQNPAGASRSVTLP